MSPQQAHFDGTLTRGKLLLVDLAGAEVRHDPKHIVLVCTVVLLYAVHVRVSPPPRAGASACAHNCYFCPLYSVARERVTRRRSTYDGSVRCEQVPLGIR